LTGFPAHARNEGMPEVIDSARKAWAVLEKHRKEGILERPRAWFSQSLPNTLFVAVETCGESPVGPLLQTTVHQYTIAIELDIIYDLLEGKQPGTLNGPPPRRLEEFPLRQLHMFKKMNYGG
jgi:hypothetical protein